jgi:hypothetical protein
MIGKFFSNGQSMQTVSGELSLQRASDEKERHVLNGMQHALEMEVSYNDSAGR